jgi:lipooligosaccharide transport system permease protein
VSVATGAQGAARKLPGWTTWQKPDISIGAVRVFQRNWDVAMRSWKTELLQFTEPFIVIFALGLGLGAFVELEDGQEYIEFLTPGLLALFPMFSTVFECAWGSYVRMEMQHTYHAMVVTPVSLDDVITGEILSGTTRAVFTATYILIVATILTPIYHMIDSPWAMAIPIWVILPGLMFSALSVAYASIAANMSSFSYFFNLIINPMFWFGGAFFPFEGLPAWVETVAWFVPLTHVVNVNRDLVEGTVGWSTLGDFTWVLIATAIFYELALRGMRRRLIK